MCRRIEALTSVRDLLKHYDDMEEETSEEAAAKAAKAELGEASCQIRSVIVAG